MVFRPAETMSFKTLLESQALLKSTKSDLAFRQGPWVICTHPEVGEALCPVSKVLCSLSFSFPALSYIIKCHFTLPYF